MTTFTNTVLTDIDGLLGKIRDLAFIRELTAGTLSRERFQFYVIQDSLYLNSYSRALSLAAAKAPDAEAMLQFTKSAQDAIAVERALHAGFLRQFGVEDAALQRAEKSPTCAGYTNFILATATTGSYEELVAAILPCFWIYWHIGHLITEIAAPANPYRAWIDTYTDAPFEAAVKAVVGITDRVAASATPATVADMRRAFAIASSYEWMFWDSAYRQEAWPVTL